ncbi:hypothetical protein NA78x_000348 [Anatilimnocola sp. NA78]|uniref:hypothetical protein n=1 Tax=Anatilimnocola sp. NA78 TaxID=3415683 RepID=UPI003CE51CEB
MKNDSIERLRADFERLQREVRYDVRKLKRMHVACLIKSEAFDNDPAAATAACEDHVAAILPLLRGQQ